MRFKALHSASVGHVLEPGWALQTGLSLPSPAVGEATDDIAVITNETMKRSIASRLYRMIVSLFDASFKSAYVE